MDKIDLEAITFTEYYFAMADGILPGLVDNLAEHVELNWFGKMITGKQAVIAFLKPYQKNTLHIFRVPNIKANDSIVINNQKWKSPKLIDTFKIKCKQNIVSTNEIPIWRQNVERTKLKIHEKDMKYYPPKDGSNKITALHRNVQQESSKGVIEIRKKLLDKIDVVQETEHELCAKDTNEIRTWKQNVIATNLLKCYKDVTERLKEKDLITSDKRMVQQKSSATITGAHKNLPHQTSNIKEVKCETYTRRISESLAEEDTSEIPTSEQNATATNRLKRYKDVMECPKEKSLITSDNRMVQQKSSATIAGTHQDLPHQTSNVKKIKCETYMEEVSEVLTGDQTTMENDSLKFRKDSKTSAKYLLEKCITNDCTTQQRSSADIATAHKALPRRISNIKKIKYKILNTKQTSDSSTEKDTSEVATLGRSAVAPTLLKYSIMGRLKKKGLTLDNSTVSQVNSAHIAEAHKDLHQIFHIENIKYETQMGQRSDSSTDEVTSERPTWEQNEMTTILLKCCDYVMERLKKRSLITSDNQMVLQKSSADIASDSLTEEDTSEIPTLEQNAMATNLLKRKDVAECLKEKSVITVDNQIVLQKSSADIAGVHKDLSHQTSNIKKIKCETWIGQRSDSLTEEDTREIPTSEQNAMATNLLKRKNVAECLKEKSLITSDNRMVQQESSIDIARAHEDLPHQTSNIKKVKCETWTGRRSDLSTEEDTMEIPTSEQNAMATNLLKRKNVAECLKEKSVVTVDNQMVQQESSIDIARAHKDLPRQTFSIKKIKCETWTGRRSDLSAEKDTREILTSEQNAMATNLLKRKNVAEFLKEKSVITVDNQMVQQESSIDIARAHKDLPHQISNIKKIKCETYAREVSETLTGDRTTMEIDSLEFCKDSTSAKHLTEKCVTNDCAIQQGSSADIAMILINPSNQPTNKIQTAKYERSMKKQESSADVQRDFGLNDIKLKLENKMKMESMLESQMKLKIARIKSRNEIKLEKIIRYIKAYGVIKFTDRSKQEVGLDWPMLKLWNRSCILQFAYCQRSDFNKCVNSDLFPPDVNYQIFKIVYEDFF